MILESLDAADWFESSSGLILPRRARKPTAVDLFCGCGGFTLGIQQAGFDVLCGVDNDALATITYLTNLGTYPIDLRFVEPDDADRLEKQIQRIAGIKKHHKRGDVIRDFPTSGSNNASIDGTGVPVFWFGDAAKLTGAQILESIGLDRGELDLVVGGPPCQGFSVAGKQDVADPRNNLVFEWARLVVEMRPRSICMENVPGMLDMHTTDGAPVVDELCRILERGDFGEFEAMRSIMTGDRRTVKRGAGRKHATRPTRPEPQRDSRQAEMFDEPREATR